MSRSEDSGAMQINLVDMGPEEIVARVIEHGAELAVSDLFFITNENHVAIKARHLGLLKLLTIIPSDLGRRCMAHIKALSGMDVTERRRPLDGRWIYRRPSGSTIDLRISTIPSLYGEDFPLRLLPRDLRM